MNFVSENYTAVFRILVWLSLCGNCANVWDKKQSTRGVFALSAYRN